jgi:hypothetical protein
MKGNIYFHKKFEFKDGCSAPKLIVVLNEPIKSDFYLVVKTTSQLRPTYTYTKGCNRNHGVFYLDANADGQFPLPTLIQLLDIYSFTREEFLKGALTDRAIDLKATFSALTMAQIINCIRQLKEDISEEYFSLLTK